MCRNRKHHVVSLTRCVLRYHRKHQRCHIGNRIGQRKPVSVINSNGIINSNGSVIFGGVGKGKIGTGS